jgi:hypothetical protein
MAVQRFTVQMPVYDTMPRNRFINTFHLERVGAAPGDGDLEGMCADIVAMWQTRYGNASKEVRCTAYDVDAVPNYPRATVVVNEGLAWVTSHPHEVALCLSYYGNYSGNKNERGRMYLAPQLAAGGIGISERPSAAAIDFALKFFSESNASLPDLGGVDWKFGVWSRNLKTFAQAHHAWVDDEWDTMRSRGLRATTRATSDREG